MEVIKKMLPILKILLNPLVWFRAMRYLVINFPHMVRSVYSFFIFFIILVFFMIEKLYDVLTHIPLLGRLFRLIRPIFRPIAKVSNIIITNLEKIRPFQVRQSYLVEIAFGNLQMRIHRTMITIFGMATGIGIIVYLLSLGYGIERLVISQVASLSELKIVDVAASQNTALKINKSTINKIKKSEHVGNVLPIISLVGRVKFNKAQTDVLVYGVDEKFLDIADLKLKKGKIFTDVGNIEDSVSQGVSEGGEVAGIQSSVVSGSYGKLRSGQLYSFNIVPKDRVPVWSECSISSDIIGYTTRLDTSLKGNKMWGSSYSPYNPYGRTGYDDTKKEYLGSWFASKVPLFTLDSEDNLVPLLGDNGYQTWSLGCIQERYIQFEDLDPVEAVLGESTLSESDHVSVLSASASATLSRAISAQGVEATGSAEAIFDTEVVATDSSGIEYVRLVSTESAQLKEKNSELSYDGEPIAQAMISTGFMKLLGISEKNVLDKTFSVSFIVSETLRPDVRGRQMSEEVSYKIIGLIHDDDSQYFYVPFSDLRKLGIQNFSQLKVVMKNENGVAKVRAEIEALGYNTSSVVDTVAQIEGLFGTLRIVLGAIGLIALAVASLGMFNTLTVSLLERTREIGGMKVIGMVSQEIQYLFLTEAMIMGFSGGVGGLFLGFMFGQITSISVSTFSIAQGLGYLNLTYIPVSFVVAVLILSFVVGILTGLYPAKRARNISALNALRYE